MIRLGLRLTLNGGKEAAVRLIITTAAVALGVGLLLAALGGMNAINAQNARAAWLTATYGPAQSGTLPGASNLPSNSAGNSTEANGSYTGPPPPIPNAPNPSAGAPNNSPTSSGSAVDPLWWRFSTDQYGNQTIDRIDVASTGPSSPVTPGISKLPGPGEFYASPALDKLLSSAPASQLAHRFPGKQVGTLEAIALPSPDSLIVVIGYRAQQLSKAPGAVQISAVNTDPRFGGPNGFDATQLQVILAVGVLALLIPILVFIGTATRLAAARREQRFAAMRLVGATPRQVSLISAVEASVAALGGVIAGFVIFFLLRPALTSVPFTGARFAPGDLSLSLADIVLVAIGVPVASAASAHLALRRVQITPLGVTRRVTPPKPRAYRLIPLVAGMAELVYIVAVGRPDSAGAQIGAYFLGGLLLMVGLVLAGPWLTMTGSQLIAVRTSRPAVLLAMRRLGQDPRTAFRAVSGLVLALFIASASIGVISTILDDHSTSTGTTSGTTLLQQFESGPSGPNDPVSLPTPSGALINELRSIPGVHGVTVIHAQPGASQGGLAVRGLVSCAALRETPALGQCAPGAASAIVSGNLSAPALSSASTLEGTVWPTAAVSELQMQALPAIAMVVATDGSSSAIERTRTVLVVAYPFENSPSSLVGISSKRVRLITELKQLINVVIVASLLVAACSLVVSVIAGISDRRRPFSLLRLTGVPVRVVRRIVELEAALPLLAASILAIGTGFLAADLFLRSQLGETLRPPGIDYYVIVAAGLLGAFGLIGITLPLIERITGPDVARNE